jgi:hypothetical protein
MLNKLLSTTRPAYTKVDFNHVLLFWKKMLNKLLSTTRPAYTKVDFNHVLLFRKKCWTSCPTRAAFAKVVLDNN